MPLELKSRRGIWYVCGTVASQRYRRSTGTGDKALAEQVRAETEARLVRASIYGAEAVATFAEAAALYQRDRGSERRLVPLIKEFGARRLVTIRPGEIRSLAVRLYPAAKAATQNRQVLTPARAVINYAADMGLGPPIRLKPFKAAAVVRHAVDRAWLDAFRAAASHRLGTLALLMFTTGARLGEALELEWRHVDLVGKVAMIPEQKNGDPRLLYLTDEVVAGLRLLPMAQAQVFAWAPSTRKWIGQLWAAACTRAGIAYRTRHEAGRHSFATEMIVRQRRDVATTAKLGGWRSPRVLLDRYAHAEALGAVADEVFGTPLAQSPKRKAKTLLKSVG